MSPSRLVVVLSLAVSSFFLAPVSQAQLPQAGDTTSPPSPSPGHDYLGGPSETVNPANGSVSVRIPIRMSPGRQLTIPLSIAYDSAGAFYYGESTGNPHPHYVATTNAPFSQGGWSYTFPALTDTLETWPSQTSGGKNITCSERVNYVFQDPTGNRHNLGLAVNTSSPAFMQWCDVNPSITQGGEGPILATSGGSGGTITDGNGTVYSFPTGGLPATIFDRNGNTISVSYSGTPPASTASITDTLGRTAVSVGSFGANPDTLTVAGLSSTYKAYWTTASANFNINVYPASGSGCGGPLTGSSNVISEVVLPNGQAYTFSYDSTYGMLNKLTYPSGGYVRYVWGLNPLAEAGSYPYTPVGGGTAFATCRYDYPAITDRYVSYDGSTEVLHQHFSYSTSWSGTSFEYNSKTTAVTTYDLVRNTSFSTVYSYLPLYNSCPPDINPDNVYGCTGYITQQIPVEQCTEYYDSSGSGGTPPSQCPNLSPGGKLLKTEIKSWPNNDPRTLGSVQTVLDNGQSSLTVNCYNGWEQLTESDSYDLGTSAVTPPTCASGVPSGTVAGSLLHKTTKTYATFTPHIVDLPSTVITYDGSGNRVAETDSYYDQTGTPNSGNPTTITKQCFTLPGGAACPQGSSSTVFTYDANGQMLTMTDPKNNQTSYSYTDSYSSCGGNAPPTGPSDAYLTQITYPVTNGVNHIVKYCYDYTSGLLFSSTDQNNLATTYKYVDTLARLTETDLPDGGKTTVSYNDAPPTPTVTTSKKINSSGLTVTSVAVSDGLGHVKQTQLTSDPQGTIYTDTAYDGLTRVYTVSNPYRSGSDPTTSAGTTTFVYDALGRKLTTTYPDSSVVTTAYCGPSTLATDPAGKWRRSRTDGLGRLVEVDEPNAIGATVASTGCPGQSDPIWVTNYTVNGLGALTQIVQNGSHTRTFTYDSLSHLLTSNNPEVGTITYTYDPDGNVATKTDARSITATYAYDALNRETSTTYSNSDPTITTTYDQSACLGLSACQNIGHATSIADGAGSELWSYQVDATNQRSVHVNQRTTSSITKTSTYYLDLAGNLTSITYPTGRIVNYTYDAANRPQTAADGSSGITYAAAQVTPPTGCLTSGVCYTPQGSEYSAAIGKTSTFNGINLSETYNNRLQPLEIKSSSSAGNASDITYSFVDPTTSKNAGHVNSITNNLDGTRSQTFTYDQLNRINGALTTSTYATSPAHCWGETYTLDAWGNLNSIGATTNSSYTGCTQEGGFSTTADGNNHLPVFGYDGSGNTLSDGPGGATYTYDAESQIKTAAGVTYLYDGSGRRVSKSSGKLYWYGSGGEILAETDPTGNTLNEYIFFGGKRIAWIPAAAATALTVQNASFETANAWTNSCGTNCYFNAGPVPDWTFSGSGTEGSFEPNSTYFNLPLPDGNILASLNAGSFTQTLTGVNFLPNTTYTLSVFVGHRLDGLITNYTVALQAGSTVLNSVSGSSSTITVGGFAQITVTYTTGSTPPSGNVTIVLSSAGNQSNFDKVTLTASGGIYYYVEDLLGTSRVMTTSTGAVCYDADFYPYGGERAYSNSCPSANAYKFEGEERDTETGNDDFGARYYSNRFGRWLSADWSSTPVAVPYANLANPQTLNLYSMVSDDPESFADLDGHCGGNLNTEYIPCPNHPSAFQGDDFYDGNSGLYAASCSSLSCTTNSEVSSETSQIAAQQLSVANVIKIIQEAQSSSSDPATTAINIFNGLGNNVSVSGDVLRQAISEYRDSKGNKLQLDDTSNALLASATSLTKSGNEVTITSKAGSQAEVKGINIKIGETVKFSVGLDKGNPALTNVKGLQAGKGIYLDVQKISVRPQQNGNALFIQAGKGFLSREFGPFPL